MKHKSKYSLTQPLLAALAAIKCGKLNCVMKAYKAELTQTAEMPLLYRHYLKKKMYIQIDKASYYKTMHSTTDSQSHSG